MDLFAMNSFNSYLSTELTNIRSKNRFRSLKLPLGIDLSSNDYLCLSQSREIKNALLGNKNALAKQSASFSVWVHPVSSP